MTREQQRHKQRERSLNILFGIRMALVVVASSYLTLGVFDSSHARKYWWAYGILVLILSISNLVCSRRRYRRARRS